MYRGLLESYQHLQQEMTSVAAQWQECEKRIDDYVDEQVNTLKSHRRTVYTPGFICSITALSRSFKEVIFFFQLLFKVEGQSLTNQRTETHKSLISKNVSAVMKANMSVFALEFHLALIHVFFSSSSQTSKSKQRMLKEDWEFFKQRKFIEEQVCLLNVASF